MASTLIGGGGLGLGVDDFADELVRDPTRRALMRRISVTSDPRCDSIFPQQAPAILSVTTKEETRIVEEVLINRGGPERPLSDDEPAAKFSENSRRALAPKTTEALRLWLDGLRKKDVSEIVRISRLCAGSARLMHTRCTIGVLGEALALFVAATS